MRSRRSMVQFETRTRSVPTTWPWRIGVAVGLAAGIVQIAFALIKPTAPPLMRTA
jgi:hypothetical protein